MNDRFDPGSGFTNYAFEVVGQIPLPAAGVLPGLFGIARRKSA